MNPATIKIVMVSIVAVFAGIFAFKSSRSLHEAKNLTTRLENEVDSLQLISNEYQELLKKYDLIYHQLDATKSHLDEVRGKINRLNTQHLQGLSEINAELDLIIENYDRTVVDLRPADYNPGHADLDTLKL